MYTDRYILVVTLNSHHMGHRVQCNLNHPFSCKPVIKMFKEYNSHKNKPNKTKKQSKTKKPNFSKLLPRRKWRLKCFQKEPSGTLGEQNIMAWEAVVFCKVLEHSTCAESRPRQLETTQNLYCLEQRKLVEKGIWIQHRLQRASCRQALVPLPESVCLRENMTSLEAKGEGSRHRAPPAWQRGKFLSSTMALSLYCYL